MRPAVGPSTGFRTSGLGVDRWVCDGAQDERTGGWVGKPPGWCGGGNVGITGRIKIARGQLYILRFQTHLTTPIIVLALLVSLVAAPVIILADGPVGAGKTDSKIGPLLQGALRGPEGTPGPGLKPEPQRQALGVGPDLGGAEGGRDQGVGGFWGLTNRGYLGTIGG